MRASDSTPFAGIELKFVENSTNRIWYKIGPALAQILCALGGHPRCIAGFLLSNLGFALTYRKKIAVENGNPIFDYFVYPPRTVSPRTNHPTLSLLRYCYGTDASPEKYEMLRILCCFAEAAFFSDAKKALATPTKLIIKRNLQLDSAEKNSNAKKAKTSASSSNERKGSTDVSIFGVRSVSGSISYYTCFQVPSNAFIALRE
jgi:hypothetical protein